MVFHKPPEVIGDSQTPKSNMKYKPLKVTWVLQTSKSNKGFINPINNRGFTNPKEYKRF